MVNGAPGPGLRHHRRVIDWGWGMRSSAALAMVLGLVVAGSANAETRTPTAWPFKATSPWNAPLGSGAQFASPTCDTELHQPETAPNVPWINADKFSFPIYQAAATDPAQTVYLSNDPQTPTPHGTSQGSYRFPVQAPPAQGTDRSRIVLEPGGLFDDETWLTYAWGGFTNVGGFGRHDLVNGDGWRPLKGFGIRAANASALGGLLRVWELQAGNVRHALAISLPHARMTPTAVAPASSIDRDHADYTGTIPMGQFFAIPPGTTVPGVTSAAGRAIVTALQTYGAYLVDGGGNFAFYAEPNALSLINPARAEVPAIKQAMQCVSNNTGPNWGGGGTPLAPPAPPFG
jgi:hypothetical protein